jgi:hypothetical protein
MASALSAKLAIFVIPTFLFITSWHNDNFAQLGMTMIRIYPMDFELHRGGKRQRGNVKYDGYKRWNVDHTIDHTIDHTTASIG